MHERRILDPSERQPDARIQERRVDAVGIHVGDAGVRVEAARLSFLVFHRVAGDDTLPRADRADPSDAALPVADRVFLDDQALLAALHLLDARCPIAEFRVDVIVPQIERLEDMTIGVDHVVGAAHQRSSGSGLHSCGILAQRPLRRKLNVVQNPERRLEQPQAARRTGRDLIERRKLE